MNNSELSDALTPTRSRALLAKIGYSPADVVDLHESGIGAVDFDELSELAAIELTGSNPPNLCSPNADWENYRPLEKSGRVMLVDFYSGAIFHPLELGKFAMFGPSGLTAQFPSRLTPAPLTLRWRFRSIPTLLAHSLEELKREAEGFLGSCPERGKIAFRGQPKQHFISREPRTSELLYGNPSTREPNLLSTAFRKRFPYASTERHWRAIVADIDYRVTGYKDTRWWVEDEVENVFLQQGMIAKWHRVSTMAIGQHYGIPTYGLDVSESIDVAWWFATHRFREDDGRASYVPHNWSLLSQEEWPVIYVFSTGTAVRVSNLQLPATRPARQSALLAQGGWGPHGNICADDLIAAISLAPTVGFAPSDTQTLFPLPTDDPFYGELLKLKARLLPSHPLYQGAGLEFIPDYTQPINFST